MVFSSEELLGKSPFSDVVIHATIMAKSGQRMSKSLGTGVDPMDLIEKYGADATRFGLVWQAMGTQDIKWAEEHVVAGRKFLNKFWDRYLEESKKNLNPEILLCVLMDSLKLLHPFMPFITERIWSELPLKNPASGGAGKKLLMIETWPKIGRAH